MTDTSSITASDVITGLENLINGALGSSESPATKARLHVIATVLGTLGNEFAPLLESKFDVSALFAAIQRIETGATETEGGVHDLLRALKHKNQTSSDTESASQSAA